MRRGSIEVRGLSVAYDRQVALRTIDACFEAGSLTAVVVPNGAGKSTLVKALVGLVTPTRGTVVRHGGASRDIAYLPGPPRSTARFRSRSRIS